MAIDKSQLERLRLSYSEVFGAGWIDGFYCPILQEHGQGLSGLIDGHILNAAIPSASRATVIQRKDIDNFFGHTIEPDAIHFLNMQKPDIAKLMRQKRRGVTAVDSKGREHDVAYGGSRADNLPFPKLGLTDEQRSIAGHVHVKARPDEYDGESTFNLRLRFVVSHAAILGTMFKSAYLALFELFGYLILKDQCLAPIRDALANFYRDDATKSNADRYFLRFEGAFNALSGADVASLGDSINNRMFLGHFDTNAGLFAKSVLLKVNDLTFAVTVPWTLTDGGSAAAIGRYDAFLSETTPTHLVKPMQYKVDEHQYEFLPISVPILPSM